MSGYKQIGGGSYGIYQKPKKPFDWGTLFGGIIVTFIALAILGGITG